MNHQPDRQHENHIRQQEAMHTLPAPAEKAAYVRRMFGMLAPGYDRINRVMTFGLDQHWRKAAVQAIAPPANGRALDVGTGTGDFLPLLAAWMPEGLAVGIDFTLPMMQTGQHKVQPLPPVLAHGQPGQAAFVGGDALRLPFPDNSFDALTTGFVLRNVTDISAALAEMLRVVRPGGAMACLEVARPANPLLRRGHTLYFQHLVPRLATLLGGDPQFYTYLPRSSRSFPSPPHLALLMREAGWQHVTYSLAGMGAVAIHVGAKIA